VRKRMAARLRRAQPAQAAPPPPGGLTVKGPSHASQDSRSPKKEASHPRICVPRSPAWSPHGFARQADLSTRVAIRAPQRMGVVLFVDLSAWPTTTRRPRTYPPDPVRHHRSAAEPLTAHLSATERVCTQWSRSSADSGDTCEYAAGRHYTYARRGALGGHP
jgi:hypothetical protein